MFKNSFGFKCYSEEGIPKVGSGRPSDKFTVVPYPLQIYLTDDPLFFLRKLEQTSFPVNAAGPRPLPVPASLVRAFPSGHFLAYLGTIYLMELLHIYCRYLELEVRLPVYGINFQIR
jgi:hypothetical protein